MPAKKTTTAAVNTGAEKKTTVKKTAAKKTTAAKTTTKTATKKACAKKPCAKKPVEVKEEVKVEVQPEVKVEVKPVVQLKSVQDYIDIINWKKGEANGMDWLYIEVKADDLLTEVEAGADNLAVVCKAMLECMLEGDTFVVDSAAEGKVDPALTVRYYCDNLSPERRKYFAN